MPKVIGYTPSWLSAPSPGSKIFSDPEAQSPPPLTKRTSYLAASTSQQHAEYQGPSRLLAKRGTQIFTVVGNKLRWADLSLVKSRWEVNYGGAARHSKRNEDASDDGQLAYRTLQTSVYYQIRQLAISPSGAFMAIATEHTVHVAQLPDPSRLRERDQSPIKLKTYQLGPTVHVIPESPVMSILWHPLAASTDNSDCLITVTAEAAVRLWEIDRQSQWSFDEPTLAIDLRRLADGVSSDEDFAPSGFGKSRGFSVDAFDMEVSSACFGGVGSDDEDPWAATTLWTAMRNGGVYALCPFIPSKWIPNPTGLATLSVSAIAKLSLAEEEKDADLVDIQQQYDWLQELDATEAPDSSAADVEGSEVRLRPSSPGTIPKLQGPFEIPLSNSTIDIDVSDIYVVPAQSDQEDLYFDEDNEGIEPGERDRLPYTVICLATTDAQVYVSLDTEGVSGQWLPKRSTNVFAVPENESRELLNLGAFRTVTDDQSLSDSEWPTFTAESSSPFNCVLTSSAQIWSISMNDWLSRLADELSASQDSLTGLKTRLETLKRDKVATIDQILDLPGTMSSSGIDQHLTCSVLYNDPSLGYLLLASVSGQCFGVEFDEPHEEFAQAIPSTDLSLVLSDAQLEPMNAPLLPARPVYTVPDAFHGSRGMALNKLFNNLPTRRAQVLKQPVRLSPAVLEVLTTVHRVAAPQCSQVERAAADLFRRSERLQQELHEHVQQIVQLAERIQQDHEYAESKYEIKDSVESSIQNRLQKIHERQRRLNERFETLRKKSAKAGEGDRPLTSKEKTWIEEISTMSKTFGLDEKEDGNAKDNTGSTATGFASRITEVCSSLLHHSLLRSCANMMVPRRKSSLTNWRMRVANWLKPERRQVSILVCPRRSHRCLPRVF